MVASSQIEFGYCPWKLCLDVGSIVISTLPDLDDKVVNLPKIGEVNNEWIYPGYLYRPPFTRRVFSLPKTHTLRHANADSNDHLVFHIWCLSFFLGIRLTTTEAGFIDTSPLQPGKLVDFVSPLGTSLQKAVEIAEAFWVANRSKPKCAKRVAAAVHALFIGQNPRLLQFEEFIFLYTALEACYALAKSLHTLPTGGSKIWQMSSFFGMTTPPWAVQSGKRRGRGEVAALRGETLHEALFMGQPLGFAVHGIGTNQNLTLELKALICRLLVALLGASSSDYVRSPINTRMLHSLDL